MIKTLLVTAAVASSLAGTANAMSPMASDGLERLATTGWADVMANEGKGVAYDKVGGMPGAFTYDIDFSASEMAASELLYDGEFTAPHWLRGFDGKDYIMVAPHIFNDGQLMKGANEHKDHFIVVDRMSGVAMRYDYSKDIEMM